MQCAFKATNVLFAVLFFWTVTLHADERKIAFKITKEGVFVGDLSLIPHQTTIQAVMEMLGSQPRKDDSMPMPRFGPPHPIEYLTQYIFDDCGVGADVKEPPGGLWRFALSLRPADTVEASNMPKQPFAGVIYIGSTALSSHDRRQAFYKAAKTAELQTFDEQGDENFQIESKHWNVILSFRHNKSLYEVWMYPK